MAMTRSVPCVVFPGSLAGWLLLGLVTAVPSGRAAAQDALWQLNSGGADIHVIDFVEGTVLERLEVGPEPHGIAAPADFHVVYVTLEANRRDRGELLWIDPATFRVTGRLDVGPEPHEIATTPDGRWIYVPCRDGRYWVVDGVEKEVVKRIPTGGRPHNTRASRDGRHMFLSPMGAPERVNGILKLVRVDPSVQGEPNHRRMGP